MLAYRFDTQCASSMTTVTILSGRGDICTTISPHPSVSDCDNSDPCSGIYLNVCSQGHISMAVPWAMALMDNCDDRFWCSEEQTVLLAAISFTVAKNLLHWQPCYD